MTNSVKVQRTRRGQSGSAADVAVIADLVFTKGKTYRDAAAYLGWTYSRVSEAARAYKGMESDNRGGRDARGRERAEHNVAVAQMTTATTIVPDATKVDLADHLRKRVRSAMEASAGDRQRAIAAMRQAVDRLPSITAGPRRQMMAAIASAAGRRFGSKVDGELNAERRHDVEASADLVSQVGTPKRRKRRLPTPDEVRARAADDLLTVDWSNWLVDGKWERSAPAPAEIWGEDEDGEAVLSGLAVDPGIMWPVGWPSRDVEAVQIFAPPARPAKRRVIVTSAQNRTPVHGPAWCNLVALAVYYDASIAIAGTTYGKGLFEGRDRASVTIAPWAAEIAEYVTRDRHHPDQAIVTIAADMNLTATMSRPLSGLAGTAAGRTTIFAHPRRALESVPRPKDDAPVHMWTTGSITCPNYVLKKEGIKARDAHCIGFLVVEEDFDGRVFVRDVQCDPFSGEFYDLDVYVAHGQVCTAKQIRRSLGHEGPAIMWGDVHEDHLDPACARAVWGLGGNPVDDIPLIDALDPHVQVVHDLLNFSSQSHHGRDDPWQRFRKVVDDRHLVEPEIAAAASLLAKISRPTTETLVVYSNHDEHFARWLRDTDWRDDPANAEIHLAANVAALAAMRRGEEFSVFEWALRRAEPEADFHLITCDQTERIFGIHYSYHGDRGPNGSRGSTAGLARMGQPVTKGHDHTLTIHDRVRSGGCLIRYPDYAVGPSTWVHGCVVGHADGTRQTVQIVDGKWRA